jgi:hypothetical protein
MSQHKNIMKIPLEIDVDFIKEQGASQEIIKLK